MSEAPETFESLAGRHLDGEMTADEQAQFYRLIMRDPQKRRQVEQAQQCDRAASAALHALLNAPSRPVRVNNLPRQKSAHRWLRAQLLATAALMLLAVGVWQLMGMEKQQQAGGAKVNQLAAASVTVRTPVTAMPKLEVSPTYATTDEASLAMTPPKLPDVSSSASLSAAPMGEMWWRKQHATVVTAAPVKATDEVKKADDKPQHYWTTLLEALDPSGKRFEVFKQQTGSTAPKQPVVNSVSGEL